MTSESLQWSEWSHNNPKLRHLNRRSEPQIAYIENLVATSKWDEHVSMLPYSLALLATLSVVPVPTAPNFAPFNAPLCGKPDLSTSVFCGSLQEAVANVVNESSEALNAAHACASKVAIMCAQIPGRAQQLERLFGDAPSCNVEKVMQSMVDRLTEEAIMADDLTLKLLKTMATAQSTHKTVQEQAAARRAELMNMSDFKGKDRDALLSLLRRTQQVLGPDELKDKWAGLIAFFETLSEVVSALLNRVIDVTRTVMDAIHSGKTSNEDRYMVMGDELVDQTALVQEAADVALVLAATYLEASAKTAVGAPLATLARKVLRHSNKDAKAVMTERSNMLKEAGELTQQVAATACAAKTKLIEQLHASWRRHGILPQ
ncbi:hypothetical protein AMAG_14233 [Allomyces macrogynus ATCC 38327]|uniref:Uncharacterized protein n=1 Tax=Allomyces macrogynus (strain ATCC 38327) TaxID=578462 RepID=A0A0L0T4K8_ALLM3|nr:hypothetical protein AMAG_14233 [Allomyces macrogynus ATCC 38327]|eukprot:KNE69677.1 hypothetical protein AMAG_14233 [Allomyces macrogynus ATCC 38327]